MENETSLSQSRKSLPVIAVVIIAVVGSGLAGLALSAISESALTVPLGAVLGALVSYGVVTWLGGSGGQVDTLVNYANALLSGEKVDLPAELGGAARDIGQALERVDQRGRNLEREVVDVADALQQLASSLEPSGQGVKESILNNQDQLRVALRLHQETKEELAGLHRVLGEVTHSAEESQSSATELATTNEVVTENVHQLAESVDETAASIEEMSYSIKEVARNIEDLSLAAEQTATSMNQMDTSISEVESNVKITSQLADEVSRDAGQGAEAVQRTLEGIDKISTTVTTAASVITSLGERIREIGNILSVIEDVAEQTNLLALNAAIIAAQAGEHGRGFAVVADEIKELADKTGASTKEISALILAIQEESRKAVEAIAVGERNVHEGVELSREAEGALAKILDSAEKSTQRFKTIAAATVEQARGSKIVADAVERIARSVQQVAAATSEQARGSEQLMRSAERIKGITHQVERTSREQGIGSKQILTFIESVGEQLQALSGAETLYRNKWEETKHQLDKIVQGVQEVDASLDVIGGLSNKIRSHADQVKSAGGLNSGM